MQHYFKKVTIPVLLAALQDSANPLKKIHCQTLAYTRNTQISAKKCNIKKKERNFWYSYCIVPEKFIDGMC